MLSAFPEERRARVWFLTSHSRRPALAGVRRKAQLKNYSDYSRSGRRGACSPARSAPSDPGRGCRHGSGCCRFSNEPRLRSPCCSSLLLCPATVLLAAGYLDTNQFDCWCSSLFHGGGTRRPPPPKQFVGAPPTRPQRGADSPYSRRFKPFVALAQRRRVAVILSASRSSSHRRNFQPVRAALSRVGFLRKRPLSFSSIHAEFQRVMDLTFFSVFGWVGLVLMWVRFAWEAAANAKSERS